MFDSFKRIDETADIVSVRAVMVHAIDEDARRFYEHFNFEPPPADPFQLMMLLLKPRCRIGASGRGVSRLTEEERSRYEAAINAADFVALLRLKALKRLGLNPA